MAILMTMAEPSVMAGAMGSGRGSETTSLTLMRAGRGRMVELVRVEGGRGLAVRLATMGLTPGARFTVESGGRTGPVLISFGGTRLVLGHGMAQRLMVRPTGDARG